MLFQNTLLEIFQKVLTFRFTNLLLHAQYSPSNRLADGANGLNLHHQCAVYLAPPTRPSPLTNLYCLLFAFSQRNLSPFFHFKMVQRWVKIDILGTQAKWSASNSLVIQCRGRNGSGKTYHFCFFTAISTNVCWVLFSITFGTQNCKIWCFQSPLKKVSQAQTIWQHSRGLVNFSLLYNQFSKFWSGTLGAKQQE